MIQTAEDLMEEIRALPESEKERFYDMLEDLKRELLEEEESLSQRETEPS